jgi:hypothetical protein
MLYIRDKDPVKESIPLVKICMRALVDLALDTVPLPLSQPSLSLSPRSSPLQPALPLSLPRAALKAWLVKTAGAWTQLLVACFDNGVTSVEVCHARLANTF